MASGFPASIDAFPTTRTGTTLVGPDVLDHADAINKIETTLGTNPNGTVYANVGARVGALETPPFNFQTGTTYTLVLADAGKVVSMNNAAANSLLIPTDAAVAFPIGTRIVVRQAGAGLTTVGLVASGTTSLNSRGARFNMAGRYAYATLVKVAANTWEIYGDIA